MFSVYLYKERIVDNIFNKISDYDAFREEIIAENNLKPSSNREDIKRELEKIDREICEDDLFFELFCGCKYSENVFNTPFYFALRETGYDVPEDKDTFSVECIRNTGIVNLAVNGVNPYLITRLAGLSLGSLDVLLRRFEVNVDEQSNISEMINQEISKSRFYQNI